MLFYKPMSLGKNNRWIKPILPMKIRYILLLIAVCFGASPLFADVGTPDAITADYNPTTNVLTLEIFWSWTYEDEKVVSVAVFADMNGDGVTPGPTDDPLTWTSGGNLIPGSALALSEFLGQIASQPIKGMAANGDNTDTGISSLAFTYAGTNLNTPSVLFPYGLAPASTSPLAVNDASNGGKGSSGGSFTLTYTNVLIPPSSICAVLYDIHTDGNEVVPSGSPGNNPDQGSFDNGSFTGKHSPISSGPNSDRNTDNSTEDGFISNVLCGAPETSITFEFADLSLEKSVNNMTPAFGSTVTFTIEVSNAGPDAATGVEVTDVVPAGLSYVPGSIAGPGTNMSSGSTLTWSNLSIAVGASVSLTFMAEVTGTGMIVNSAEVTASDQEDPDSQPGNNIPTEDDQDNACVSVPIDFCPPASFTLTAPSGFATYVWKKDGVIIPGASSNTLLVTEAGSYTFEAVNAIGCTIDSECPALFTNTNCCIPTASCKTLPTIDTEGCADDIPDPFVTPSDVLTAPAA